MLARLITDVVTTVSHLAPECCTNLHVALLGLPQSTEHEAEMESVWGCWQVLD